MEILPNVRSEDGGDGMRLIDADAMTSKIQNQYCEDCDRRKGENNGKRYMVYEIGDAPCRACSIDDMYAELYDAPTIQPEPQEIGYDDCANVLLKMWMDNVLTDGEYYRIANKLNVKWGKVELPEPYKGVTE
jgi:hypothetical protein